MPQMVLGLPIKWAEILSRLSGHLSPAEAYMAALCKPELRINDFPPLTQQQEQEADHLNQVCVTLDMLCGRNSLKHEYSVLIHLFHYCCFACLSGVAELRLMFQS